MHHDGENNSWLALKSLEAFNLNLSAIKRRSRHNCIQHHIRSFRMVCSHSTFDVLRSLAEAISGTSCAFDMPGTCNEGDPNPNVATTGGICRTST